MAIGTALLLVAVGAILAYAVDVDVPGVDVQTVGSVLFFVGLLGLAITVGLELLSQRARRPSLAAVEPRVRERVRPRDVVDARPVARRPAPPPPAPYDPVVGPPAGDPATRPTRVARRDEGR
jgi:hypothetical protein